MKEIGPSIIKVTKNKTMKTVGSYELTHINQLIISSLQGQQGSNSITHVMNLDQMTGNTSGVDTTFSVQWATNPWLL
ncbi:hypothetical protein MEO41_29030, partial [Dolichospermum sp. ST_sed4]|nr:hypothetical protein [Dolichospermum sp. ST_sed4]